MFKGQTVTNLISGAVATLTTGVLSDYNVGSTSGYCGRVMYGYSVKLANGQYRYWSSKNVVMGILK